MYLETTLNAQAYFARALEKNREANLKERLDKLNAEYNAKLEQEHNVESIDYKIKETRERLAYIITELRDRFDNYTVTDFVSKVAQLDYLEKQKEKQDKVQKETDLIKEMFGDFNTYHEKKVKKHGVWGVERTAKSSEDLANERNERLATLNKLLNKNQISQEDFVKAVVAVRRRYSSEIQKQVAWETKKEENQKPSKLKSIINKVKTAFHLHNDKEQEKTENKSTKFYSEHATHALIKAHNFLSDEQSETLQNEARNCLTDAVETNSNSMNIYSSEDLKSIVNDMFKKKKEHIEKTTTQILVGTDNQVLSTREERIQRKLNDLADERLNYFSIFDSKEKVKKSELLKNQEQELENYILHNYKHSYGQGVIQNGSIVLGEIQFEDKNIQALYAEMKAMFKSMQDFQKVAQDAEKSLEANANKIAENLQQASI